MLKKIMAVTDKLPIDRNTAIRIFDGSYRGTTRNQLIALVKKFFAWVEEVYGIPHPIPSFRAVPARRSQGRVLTEAEIRQLLAAAKKAQNLALIMLILDTGLRIGEVHSLTKRSLHLYDDRMELEVDGKVGVRKVPVSPIVFEMLKALGDDVHIWVSSQGNPIKRDTLQKRFRGIMKRAGLEGRRIGPHTARHTSATMFIRKGGHVVLLKDLLGHLSIETTLEYIHMAADDLHAAHAQYGILATMGLSEEGSSSPRLPTPHVTRSGAYVNRVEEQWICPAPDAKALAN